MDMIESTMEENFGQLLYDSKKLAKKLEKKNNIIKKLSSEFFHHVCLNNVCVCDIHNIFCFLKK